MRNTKLRLIPQFALGFLAIAVSGCKNRPSVAAPTAPVLPVAFDTTKPFDVTKSYTSANFNTDVEIYKTAVAASFTDPTQLAKAKQARNDIIWGEMGAIEGVYSTYHTHLFSDKNQLAIGSDGLSLGLSAAASIATHAPTKTILSSLGTAFTGLGLSVDKNYFGQQSFQILGLAMQTRRDKVRTSIASNLSLCDVNAYPLLQAQRDLIQYFSAGTLDSALEELQEEAGTATAQAASGGSTPAVNSQPSAPATTCPISSAAPTATPTFNPAGGAYDVSQQVTISDTAPGAKIYFTTDGTLPTPASTQYGSPIQVNATETIQAIAVAPGSSNSAVASAAYTLTGGAVVAAPAETPTFSPAGGSFAAAQSVTISDTTAGAKIYYTTDGTVPTTTSNQYSGAIQVNATETIQAIAVAPKLSNSAVAASSYTISKGHEAVGPSATPTFSPTGGAFAVPQPVTISDTTPGAKIYYTTDGTVPTMTSKLYSTPIQVNVTETIQAIAVAPNYAESAIGAASYTISKPMDNRPALLTPH